MSIPSPSRELSKGDQQVLDLARELGMIRARDLEARGLARTYLRRLQDRGLLLPASRGLYLFNQADITENQTLAEVALRVPRGVVCLLSALRFHEIGTQCPAVVWLCIETGGRAPRLDYPRLEVVRQSGAAWREGVEEHPIAVGQGKVTLRITSPAKTIADCWKFRNQVGIDVALEALRDGLRPRRVGDRIPVNELWHFARINRVTRSMGPAMEAMLAE